ncbi:MAG: hypothetical protein VX802_00650, partial [Pseudomonadota bacterium]|nr:hypothetical protein [Pseudomonadota bacterium]
MVGVRSKATARKGRVDMARLIAVMGTSHVPGVGAAMDNGKTHEDYWLELFKGFEPIRAWHAKNVPDVNIIVFN